ncbi:MAG: serine/threonine protein kinase [Actinobacteria bacterium]|nr:MAG: serine/threonine protein kinase [Actinomycetota bacterium]
MGGEVIAGRFELLRLLGRGAMSEVWLATDRQLDRPVAVKLHALHADPERFAREARAAAALSHENVGAIYDFGETEDGRPFLVLEYLPGGTLEERLPQGEPQPDDETHRIARELAAGLAHAHEQGVVHRDLKPSNVLFDAEGRVKLADFGIARAAGQATLTEAGTVLGTAAYISPEQAAGDPVGPASDVYSFAVILFRMLTGRLPFEGEHPLELAVKHRDEPAPDTRSLRPDAPVELATLAAAALAKDPRARPPDGSALVRALDEPPTIVLPPTTDAATPATAATAALAPSRPPGMRRRVNRARLMAILGALALLGAGLAVAFLTVGGGGSSPASTSLPRETTTRQQTTRPATTQGTATTQSTTVPATTTPPPSSTTPGTTIPGTTAPGTTAPVTTTGVTTAPA